MMFTFLIHPLIIKNHGELSLGLTWWLKCWDIRSEEGQTRRQPLCNPLLNEMLSSSLVMAFQYVLSILQMPNHFGINVLFKITEGAWRQTKGSHSQRSLSHWSFDLKFFLFFFRLGAGWWCGWYYVSLLSSHQLCLDPPPTLLPLKSERSQRRKGESCSRCQGDQTECEMSLRWWDGHGYLKISCGDLDLGQWLVK